jgi:5,5'-dehydrodivanillate O-demethylase
MQWRVPLNDTTCFHVSYYTWRAAPSQTAPVQANVPYRYTQLKGPDGKYIVDLTFNQDYMAWVTQGPIAKRHLEKLGESDRGIILFRKMLKDQVELMQEKGGWPTANVFRDPIKNAILEPPVEPIKFGNRHAPLKYVPGEAGYSRDAGKIQEVLNTWNNPARETVRA